MDRKEVGAFMTAHSLVELIPSSRTREGQGAFLCSPGPSTLQSEDKKPGIKFRGTHQKSSWHDSPSSLLLLILQRLKGAMGKFMEGRE